MDIFEGNCLVAILKLYRGEDEVSKIDPKSSHIHKSIFFNGHKDTIKDWSTMVVNFDNNIIFLTENMDSDNSCIIIQFLWLFAFGMKTEK